MTNQEILLMESNLRGFEYDGENLHTYAEWKSRGKQVKKGEKAFLKCKLWKYTKSKDKEGNELKKCYLVNASLFTDEQVEELKRA